MLELTDYTSAADLYTYEILIALTYIIILAND